MKDLIARAWRDLARTISFEKRRCYRALFAIDSDAPLRFEAERVLADLRRVCFAERSGFDPDPQLAAFRAGKREVWLHIQYHLNLTDAEVHRLQEVESDYDEQGE